MALIEHKPRIINLPAEEFEAECRQAKDYLFKTIVRPLIISITERGITGSRFVDYGDGYEVLDGSITELPILMSGTPFAERIYNSLLSVEAGTTISYSSLATLAGYEGAARAVGTAMAKNRHPWLIPCHRVVRSDGTPGNYTISKECSCKNLKQLLLDYEKCGS